MLAWNSARLMRDSLAMWIQMCCERRSTRYVLMLGGFVLWLWGPCYSPLLPSLPLNQKTWIHVKNWFGENVCLLRFMEMILALTCFVTVKVPYTLLKIRCSMREQSTLMSSTIMFAILLHKVNLRYAKSALMIILLIWWQSLFLLLSLSFAQA